MEIDTSAAGFTKAPAYLTSIGGEGNHWATTASNSIYQSTAKSFRVYLRWDKSSGTDEAITPEVANTNKGHINWIAVEPSTKTHLLSLGLELLWLGGTDFLRIR